MKTIFISFFATACLLGAQNASATLSVTMTRAGVFGDTGTSLYVATDGGPGSGTECDESFTACTTNAVVCPTCSCPSGYGSQGRTVTNNKCCARGCLRADQQPANIETVQSSVADSSLEDVYSPNARTNDYFGMVNTTNRSSNFGRTISIDARLDACMGHAAVDTFNGVGTSLQQWQTCTTMCGNSANSGVSNYCTDNSSEVCKDRCDCKYSMGGTCQNL